MSPRRRQGGFTLLEVLVAAMVLAIGILATMKLAVQVTTSLYDVRMQTQAAGLAANKLAELEVDGPDGAENHGDFGDTQPDFAWRLNTEATGEKYLRRLTLTVSWDQGRRELVFERLVYKP